MIKTDPQNHNIDVYPIDREYWLSPKDKLKFEAEHTRQAGLPKKQAYLLKQKRTG